VVLGSVGGGSGAAGVALQNQIKISPTVRVMQGTPIQVFAARDLDFTDDGQ
jgi:type IV secretion system protein VirB10